MARSCRCGSTGGCGRWCRSAAAPVLHPRAPGTQRGWALSAWACGDRNTVFNIRFKEMNTRSVMVHSHRLRIKRFSFTLNGWRNALPNWIMGSVASRPLLVAGVEKRSTLSAKAGVSQSDRLCNCIHATPKSKSDWLLSLWCLVTAHQVWMQCKRPGQHYSIYYRNGKSDTKENTSLCHRWLPYVYTQMIMSTSVRTTHDVGC